MRVGADDQVDALVGQPLGGLGLELRRLVAALDTPMAADDEHVAVGAHGGDLRGDRLAVVEVDDAVLGPFRRRQAVGGFGVGKIAERDAVDGLVNVIVIAFQVIEPGDRHIVRHGGPMRARGGDAFGPFVVAVVVGDAEHAEAQVVQRVGDVAGGREHRVGAGRECIVDEGLLVEPVHVKLLVKLPHRGVGLGKIVGAILAPVACLQVDAVVDQVVAGGRKPHRLHQRRRFRRRGGRGGRGGRGRRRGGPGAQLPLVHKSAGQYAAHAQRDQHAGGDLISS